MSFKVEYKDAVLVLRFGGDEFLANDVQQLRSLLAKQTPQTCFIHLKNPEVIEATEELEDIQMDWEEKGHHMVFIAREAHQFLFHEDCACVGSHQEAMDWLKEAE